MTQCKQLLAKSSREYGSAISLRIWNCQAAGHAAAAVAKMKSLQPWAYPKFLKVSQRLDAALRLSTDSLYNYTLSGLQTNWNRASSLWSLLSFVTFTPCFHRICHCWLRLLWYAKSSDWVVYNGPLRQPKMLAACLPLAKHSPHQV